MTKGSVTGWLEELRQGDQEAARSLWQRYYTQLVRLARDHLGRLPRAVGDEEDVALTAFAAFCSGLTDGRFPDLRDRDGLWRLLLTLTERRAVDLVRHEQTQRRGAGKRADAVELDGLPADVLTPEFAAEVAEETERLLKMLDGDLSGKLREIAIWKMEGYTNEQIAARLGCVLRSVERKLRTIREIWGEEVPS